MREVRTKRGASFFRSILCRVQHCKNSKAASVNLIRNNVRGACDDEFARFWFPAGTPEVGMLGEPVDRLKDPHSQTPGGVRFVLLDVLANLC